MAKINHLDIGDVWVAQATFTVSGTPTDPTHLTVRQQAPDGTQTVLANAVLVSGLTGSSTPVAKTSTGVFKLNPGITLNAPGPWYVKFEGDGTAAATEQQEVIADPDEFNTGLSTQALVTLSETKNWLEQKNIDTSDDWRIVRVINDVSDRFTFEAQREFKQVGANGQVRDFELEEWNWKLREVEVGDMSTVTSAQLLTYAFDGTVADTTALSNLILQPRVRSAWEPVTSLKWPYSFIQPAWLYRAVIRVTGNWGFPSVPGNVRQAVLNAIAVVLDTQPEHYQAEFGSIIPSASTGGEAGNVIVMAGRAQKLLTLPPESMAVAWSYRRDSILV